MKITKEGYTKWIFDHFGCRINKSNQYTDLLDFYSVDEAFLVSVYKFCLNHYNEDFDKHTEYIDGALGIRSLYWPSDLS